MFLPVDDADLFVADFGDGPRTLLAHGGWVGSGELWQATFGPLSKRWRTVAYDHRGTGATRHRTATISFERLVQDVFDVLDALDIRECVLAGESSGSMVVLEAALRQPERFSGLVLVDGRCSSRISPGGRAFLEGCRTDFPAAMKKFVAACVNEADCESERRWLLQLVMRSSGPEAIQLMECLQHVDLEARLPTIRQPTLLIHGRLDQVTPLATSEAMASAIPASRLLVIEDAGHVPILTRPQAAAEAIDAFMAALPADSQEATALDP